MHRVTNKNRRIQYVQQIISDKRNNEAHSPSETVKKPTSRRGGPAWPRSRALAIGDLSWQPKAHDIWTDRERYKLLPADRISHRRGLALPIGREMPQHFPVPLVDGHKITVGVPVEYYSPSRRQHSRVSLAFGRSDLRLFPNYLSAFKIERAQVLLPGFLLWMLCLPTAGRKLNNALLEGHDVIETCHRAERS